MKKIALKIFGAAAIFLCSSAITEVKAQVSNNNTIQEVVINPNDGFKDLKNLISQNFDFTNPDLEEGEAKSVVKFEISETGKISNVQTEGNCKYVNNELEKVMKDLIYKFKAEKLRPYVYVMPVKVAIASR